MRYEVWKRSGSGGSGSDRGSGSGTADIVVKAASINDMMPLNLPPTTDIVVILLSGPGGLEDGAHGLTSIN